MQPPQHPELTPPGVSLSPADVGRMARNAAEAEALASPKPGLVCPDHQGAHKDMDFGHFMHSAAALEPYFGLCYRAGLEHPSTAPATLLPLLRALGQSAEAAMLAATGGVNTHKGLIFSLGLVCAGLGRVGGRQLKQPGQKLESASPAQPTGSAVCAEAAALAAGLVRRELQPLKNLAAMPAGAEADAKAGAEAGTETGAEAGAETGAASAPLTPLTPLTAGQRLYVSHGITGARGEAEKGFPTALLALGSIVRHENSLPPEHILPQALLEVLAVAEDSNVLARAGTEGLRWLHAEAAKTLELGGMHTVRGQAALLRLRDACATRGISPGGSADMLAVGIFLRLLQG